MTRHLFGGQPSDLAMQIAGTTLTVKPGATLTVWDSLSGGNQLTDLTDLSANPISQVVADNFGGVTFWGPDDSTSLLYIDGGLGVRYAMQAVDLGQSVAQLSSTTTSAIANLTTLVNAAIPSSSVTTGGDLLVGTGPGTVGRLGVGTSGRRLVPDSAGGGLRWGLDWRRRYLPDALTAMSLSSESVTHVTTQQATSTISGAQALITPDTGPFLYLGAGSFTYGSGTPDSSYYLPLSRYPNTYASGQGNWSIEFMTDAAQFEIKFKYISAATEYRLSIDGRAVTDLMQASGGTTAGSSHVLKVTLGSAVPRRIRFDFVTMPFGGLFLPSGATAWKPTSRGGRLGVLGDSITDGSAYNTGGAGGTWLQRAGRLLGCTDVWDQARGGTGYITPGSFATFANRVALDITPYGFDRLIVWGGYNDNGGSQSDIGTAAASLYATLKTVVAPGGDIIVIGCWSPTGSPGASITNTDTTLRTAAAGAMLPFISPITGSIYDKTGTLVETHGPWITTANASTYVNATDNVHPNDAGHIYLARRITEALRALMPA